MFACSTKLRLNKVVKRKENRPLNLSYSLAFV